MNKSTDTFKFVAWAIGIGAGSTFMILTYASSTYSSKETLVERHKAVDARIGAVEKSVDEIKKSNDDFRKWLRDNWDKRRPVD